MIEEKPSAKTTPKATPKKKAATNGHTANGKRAKGTLYSSEALAQIVEDQKRWEETSVAQALKRMPEPQAETTTQSGMPIKRLYTPEDGASLDYERDLGFPGEYPYTRG